MTTDQYLRTPETVLPQELVYGLVRDAAAPTPGHQAIVGAIYIGLARHLAEHGAGRAWLSPIDVVLDRVRHLVVQPDLMVVTTRRLHLVSDRVWGAPDLVIEVMSPRPRIDPLDERLAWFEQYGVRECWLVHHLSREVDVVRIRRRKADESARRLGRRNPIGRAPRIRCVAGVDGATDGVLSHSRRTSAAFVRR